MIIAPPSPLLDGPLAPTRTSATNSANAAAGDFESFLTLLTAQMRNQDPLSPLDATEFVAQLASFSTVEQLVSVNDRLDGLVDRIGAQGIAGIAQWIGRDAALADGSFRATGGPVTFVAPATAAGETIEAIIRTPQGKVLRRLAVLGDANGLAQWDGRDADGRVVVPQDLALELTIKAQDSAPHTLPGEVLTRVTGVTGTADGPRLELADGRTVAPEALSRLRLPPPG